MVKKMQRLHWQQRRYTKWRTLGFDSRPYWYREICRIPPPRSDARDLSRAVDSYHNGSVMFIDRPIALWRRIPVPVYMHQQGGAKVFEEACRGYDWIAPGTVPLFYRYIWIFIFCILNAPAPRYLYPSTN